MATSFHPSPKCTCPEENDLLVPRVLRLPRRLRVHLLLGSDTLLVLFGSKPVVLVLFFSEPVRFVVARSARAVIQLVVKCEFDYGQPLGAAG